MRVRALPHRLPGRPPPGLRDHPGREPRPAPDRPSLWRSEHPVAQRVFQSTTMQTSPDQPDGAAFKASWPPRPESTEVFAALVRHELVNPLNALSGWLHLLALRPAVSEDIAARALDGARRAVDQQLEQIEMLSRVLLLSAPGSRLDTEPVSITELIRLGCKELSAHSSAVVEAPPTQGANVPAALHVHAHRQALSATLSLLLRHVAEQGAPQSRLTVGLAVEHGVIDVELRIAPALSESARTILQPFDGSAAPQTRSLQWLHALAVLRALDARIDPLVPHDDSAGLRLRVPVLAPEAG